MKLFNDLKIERKRDVITEERSMHEILFYGVEFDFDTGRIREAILSSKAEEKKAFLRGVYLGCGIISTPPSYHLELRFEKEEELKIVSLILSQFKVRHHSTTERIYIKGRENIKDFLYLIKAYNAYMELEEDLVKRSVSNIANRLANFEYANLKRQANSASEDVKKIKALIERGDIDNLDEDLKEIAFLRLEFPFLSLREIAEKTKGRFTKQEVYYRLRKIASYGKQK